MATTISKRIGESPEQRITARVARGGTESTFDPWAGTWGDSWAYSWLQRFGVSAFGHTARVSSLPATNITKRVTL